MPNKKITRDGTPRLVAEETMKEVCDLLDALLNLEFSPAGSGELVVNGRKAILKIEPGALAAITPFKVVNASTDSSARVRVFSGNVSGLDPIVDGPFSAGDDPPVTIAVGGNGIVHLAVGMDYNAITGLWTPVSYDVGFAASLPGASATTAYYALKTVAFADGKITSLGGGVTGNVGVQRCGDDETYNDQFYLAP